MQGRSGFGRWGAAVVCALAIGVVAAPVAQAEKGGGLKAKITRNKQGIPTIEADNYKSLGFGYGYAFAEDDICTIADTYLTSQRRALEVVRPRREESPRASPTSTPTSSTSGSRTSGTVEELINRKAPAGPKPEVKQIVKGYVKGYNRYLEEDRRRQHPRPALRRPALGPADHQDGRLPALLRARPSTRAAASRSTASPQAQPPAAAPKRAYEADAAAAEAISPEESAQAADLADALDLSEDTGSNGWGLGTDATKAGGGIVLANPHFPWQGPRRFYQSHLVIPGKLNVSGASLLRRAGDQHRPHREPRLDAHGLDRVPVHADRSSTSTRATRPATSSTASRVPMEQQHGHGPGQAARRHRSRPVTRTLYTTEYGPITERDPGPVGCSAGRTPPPTRCSTRTRQRAAAQPLLRHRIARSRRRSCWRSSRSTRGSRG